MVKRDVLSSVVVEGLKPPETVSCWRLFIDSLVCGFTNGLPQGC